MIDREEILFKVQKMHPEKGDLVIVSFPTDEEGESLYALDEVKAIHDFLYNEFIKNEVYIVTIPDKYSIRTLQEALESFSEAKKQTVCIENGNGQEQEK